MAKKSTVVRGTRKKRKVQIVHRCFMCGRAKGYMRKFDLCRIHFRELASKGELPGVKKSSW